MPQSELRKAIEEMDVADIDAGLCTQLCDCITRRVEIEFLYEDDPYFICQPHVLFVSPDNVLLLEGFRPGGGFRDFDVRHIRDFVITNRRFEPDLSINLDNAKYRKVFCPVQDIQIPEQ